MKIGVLTSSRADIGIYEPILHYWKKLNLDFELIVFGPNIVEHEDKYRLYIENSGFKICEFIPLKMNGDGPMDVSRNFGETVSIFSEFWRTKHFDWVLSLGDRSEMAAAVVSTVPFGINVAHLHAGECTEGSIDEIYRHQITLVSKLQFVSHSINAKRVSQLLNGHSNVFIVGAIGINTIKSEKFTSLEVLKMRWGINFTRPFLLMTIHPETRNNKVNKNNAFELDKAIKIILKKYDILATGTNLDLGNKVFKNLISKNNSEYSSFQLIENLGRKDYFSFLNSCSLVIGNSSSGIIESASFQKYNINIGARQRGRLSSKNTIHVNFNCEEIVNAVEKFINKKYQGKNIYFKPEGLELLTQKLLTTYAQ